MDVFAPNPGPELSGSRLRAERRPGEAWIWSKNIQPVDRLLIFSSSEVRLPLLTLCTWLYIYYKSCKNRKPRATKALCPSVSLFFVGLVAFPLLNIGISGFPTQARLGIHLSKIQDYRIIKIDNAFFAAKVRGVPALSVVETLGRRGVRKRAKSGVDRWSLGFVFRKSW